MGLHETLTGVVVAASDRARPLIDRFVSVALVQTAVVLAAQTLMALFPLIIGIVAFAPASMANAIVDSLGRRLGVHGDTSENLHTLINSRDEMRGSLGVLGLIVVFASATSFTRALQRAYENSWGIPRLGLRGSVRGLAWLAGLVVYLTFLALAVELTRSHAPAVSVLRSVLLLAAAFVLWWITPYLLLCGRVRLRALVLTGALTAIVMTVVGAVSARIMPRVIRHNEAQYGTIGAVFAVQSWLVVAASAVIGAAILGALAAQASGRVGALTRGTPARDGWRREPQARSTRLARFRPRA